MSYVFTATATQALTAAAVVTQVPFSVSLWASGLSAGGLFSLESAIPATQNSFQLTRTSGLLFSRITYQGAETTFSSSNSIPNGYYHCGYVADSSETNLYLNGTQTNNTTAYTAPIGIDTLQIARRRIGNSYNHSSGNIGEIGIWNVALSADEMASLWRGAQPRKVRPQSIVFYAPLIRNLIDVCGGLSITNVNSTPVATTNPHPRVFS